MATSREQGRAQLITRDGIVTATVVDTLSVDRMAMVLFKGSAAAIYGNLPDQSGLVPREVKDLIIFPFSEL